MYGSDHVKIYTVAVMENHPFPSYNHPFYPAGGHQQSFIDYGSASTLNIDIARDGRLVTTSRNQQRDAKSQRACLVGAHPSLPLFLPCYKAAQVKVLPEGHNHIFPRTDVRKNLVGQIKDFCRNNSEVVFKSISGLIEEEFHCKPWDTICFNYNDKKHLERILGRRKYSSPNVALDNFCDVFVTLPLDKHLGLNQRDRLPDGMCEAINDIQPKLLYNLLKESVEQEREEILHFDILQGNTLAYSSNQLNHLAGTGILFYPGGPFFEELNANVIRFENPQSPSTLWQKPVVLPNSKNATVNGPIRQISALSYEYGDTLVATRSRYNCSFFSTKISTTDKSEITIKTIDSLDKENQVMSLAISPFIPGEGIYAMETGQVFLWHQGKEAETRYFPSVAEKENWYQCIFAFHPRCILIANNLEADIMDFRASGSFSRKLFSITCKQVSTQERISAIQRSPEDTHHYIVATDQSLMIMDDRFGQHPVLKWRHHLQDPIQYIEVISNAIPNCKDNVVIVSGSQHRETHCFQYKQGEYEARHTFPFSGDSIMNPPVSTELPWKVSCYDEWLSLLPFSIFPISPVLEDRLANPLIGLCSIPMIYQQNRKGIMVLQMSSAGDVFYQQCVPDEKGKARHHVEHPRNFKTSSDYNNISDDDVNFLKNWISKLVAVEEKDKDYPLQSNMTEKDCQKLFFKIISLDEPHPSCALCVKDASCDTLIVLNDMEVANKIDSVCPRCGIDINFGRQLKKCQALGSSYTEKIQTEEGSDNFGLLANATCHGHSMKSFVENWISDTPFFNIEKVGEEMEMKSESEVP